MRASEEKYRLLFAHMPNGCAYCKMVFDKNNQPVDLIYLEVNDAFERITGLSKENVIGKRITEAEPTLKALTLEIIDTCGQVVLTGKPASFEIFFKPLDIWLHLTMNSAQKNYFIAMFENITERKKVEMALIKSEDKFSKAFRQSPEMLIISTLKDGRYIEVNDAFYAVFGFNKDEVLGHTSFELGIWEKAADRQKIVESLNNNIFIRNMEIELRTKQGQVITCRGSIELIEVENEPCLLFVMEDVTERKKIEDALRSSEQEYRTLARNLPAIVYRVHLEQPHITEFFNEWVFDITGFKIDELFLGEISAIDPLMLPEDRLHYTETITNSLDYHQPFEIEYRIKNKKGEICYCVERGRPVIRADGQPIYIDGIISDITEKKLVENALVQSEDRYRMLFETMVQGVIYHDGSGKIMSANPAAINIMGGSLDEMHNSSPEKISPRPIKEDGSEFADDEHPSAVALKTGQAVKNVIMGVYNSKENSRRWIDVTAVPLFRTGESRPYSVYSTFMDITDIKKAKEQTLEIETLKRLNLAKSELLSNVSHELRTPLASIKGFIETLLEQDVQWSKEKQLDFLSEANHQADILTALIRDLLDMSRLDSGKFQIQKHDCTLDNLFQEVRGRLIGITQNHFLQFEVVDGLPIFQGDKNRLAQVIVNLVENAVKFSEARSVIKIEAAVSENELIVSVTDQGIGMDQETLGKIFNRFYQAEQTVNGKTRGTGLGLAISKGIIEAHSGKIWVESQPGKGSKFSFSVPL